MMRKRLTEYAQKVREALKGRPDMDMDAPFVGGNVSLGDIEGYIIEKMYGMDQEGDPENDLRRKAALEDLDTVRQGRTPRRWQNRPMGPLQRTELEMIKRMIASEFTPEVESQILKTPLDNTATYIGGGEFRPPGAGVRGVLEAMLNPQVGRAQSLGVDTSVYAPFSERGLLEKRRIMRHEFTHLADLGVGNTPVSPGIAQLVEQFGSPLEKSRIDIARNRATKEPSLDQGNFVDIEGLAHLVELMGRGLLRSHPAIAERFRGIFRQ